MTESVSLYNLAQTDIGAAKKRLDDTYMNLVDRDLIKGISSKDATGSKVHKVIPYANGTTQTIFKNGNVVTTEYLGAKEEYLAIKAKYRSDLAGSFTVQLEDGRFIKTTDRLLPDGGFISVQTDVTAFKSIELQVKLKNDQLQQVNSE